MILYDHPLSSYGQKVKIALREKGIAFTRIVPEDFGTGRQDTDRSRYGMNGYRCGLRSPRPLPSSMRRRRT